MNPSNPTKHCTLLLLMLLTTAGCAATKKNSQTSMLRENARQQSVLSRRSDSLDSHRSLQESRIDSSSYTLTVSTEEIPSERVRLSVPIRSLELLPPQATFHSRNGHTSVQVQMCGDTVIVTAESAGIARNRYRVEHSSRNALSSERTDDRESVSAVGIRLQQETTNILAHTRQTSATKRPGFRWIGAILLVIPLIVLLSRTGLPNALRKIIGKLR